MASHVTNFLKGAQGLKLKELVPYASKYYKDNLTYSKLRPQFTQGLDVSLTTAAELCAAPAMSPLLSLFLRRLERTAQIS